MSGYLEYKLYLLKRNKMAKSNLHKRENYILKPCHFAEFYSNKYEHIFTGWSNNEFLAPSGAQGVAPYLVVQPKILQ